MFSIIPHDEIPLDYLSDESRLVGSADSLSFPENAAELVEALRRMAQSKTPMTVQGARTGITGGAVPSGGHIINLSRMKKILGFSHDEQTDEFFITVEPGLALADLNEIILRKEFPGHALAADANRALELFHNRGRYFFPPDPTETTATLGGMAACNASGARSFRFGPTRDYIMALRIVFATGEAASFKRGEGRSQGREFSLLLENGNKISGRLPGYAFRSLKNAAGYFTGDDIDLIDLFIGQEGTLGVIGELCLKLMPLPAATLGVLYFFMNQEQAVDFAARARRAPARISPSAIEFFDKGALDVISLIDNPDVRHPDPRHQAAVYLEADNDDEEILFEYFASLSGIVESLGEDPEANWAGSDERETKQLHLFRHAVPEAVNSRIAEYKKADTRIVKLGTDFAVQDGDLPALVGLYRDALEEAGLEYVMFGHIGNNHLHTNILPRNHAEYEKGRELFREIACRVIALGGTISAEHGIGKLKRELLHLMYGPEGIGEMKRLKKIFDPDFLLNRGNLFEIP